MVNAHIPLYKAVLTPLIAACVFVSLLFTLSAAASPALAPASDHPSYVLKPYIDVLEDTGAALSITQVADAALQEKFRPAPDAGGGDMNFGYSHSAYWLRFSLDTADSRTWLLEVPFPSLDHIEFYGEDAGRWQKLEAGDLKPFAARPVINRSFVFPLHLEQPGRHTFYLRVTSAGTLTIPVMLWQPEAFDLHNQNTYAALALYFGMLLALMLYNLMLYFTLRDRSYLAYVGVVFGMALGQISLTGLGNQFLWPEWPEWGNVALPAGFALTGFFASLFTRSFLDTARIAPLHDRLMIMLTWLSAFIAVSPAFLPYAWPAVMVSILGFLFPIAAISTGIVCLRHKAPGAPYFLLAWTLLLFGSAVLGLRNLNLVPTNFLTLYAMLIGSSIEILLLSFALAHRIHILRREKEMAQSAALQTSRNAERELERKVAERTCELLEANVGLEASKLHELNRSRVLEALAKGTPIRDILTILAHGVEQKVRGWLCSILLLDENAECLLLGAAPSLPGHFNVAVHGLRVGDRIGSCGTAAFRGERVVVEDIRSHPYWEGVREDAARAGLVSCWSDPIRSSKGEVLGTFAIYQKQTAYPDADDIEIIQQSCHLASIAIERKRLDDLMWAHANNDPLTKLPNRRLFRDRLQQEIKKTQRARLALALLFIDLDLFKEVNDTLGHDIGDLLLVDVAHRISACVRASDTVARISGDEFTVILPELHETECIENIAQKILHELTQPFRIGKETIYISASIGITLYPDHADDLEGLLKNADQAMYVAKAEGRNSYSYFTRQLQEDAQHRMHLIKDLRDALPQKQMSVYFQPIVDMKNGRIIKAEALLRWSHPERGMVSPEQFIPLAEEVGLIKDIGNWVFRESAGWMKRWHDLEMGCLQVSVNKSPRQFTTDQIQNDWLDHLQSIGLPASCIVVEITENMLLNEREDVKEKLLHLRDAGIQVAIDDFGTGYSSLSYLKKFDIDYLKIDQSFVRDLASDPNDLALSEAIIVMAHKLGLKVIAEGVETEAQHDMLLNAGCDYAQGYLYARPMPAEEFDAMLARQTAYT